MKIAAYSKGEEDLGDLSGVKHASDKEVKHQENTTELMKLIDSLKSHPQQQPQLVKVWPEVVVDGAEGGEVVDGIQLMELLDQD
jgi:hypothetical protein